MGVLRSRRLLDKVSEIAVVAELGKEASMSATRLDAEQRFHDRQAAERASSFEELRHLQFRDEWYLDHETWIRPAIAQLEPLAGRRLLDFGCGHGMASVVCARRGALVTGFDLSPGYLQEAARRAAANSVTVSFLQADGERLPFADNSFDRIWGNAILHHLELHRAARELVRVLRPGGVAVFCEPWGENPLLTLARRHLPYPGKQRTPDEEPLRSRQLAPLREAFDEFTIQSYQLLSMVRRLRPSSSVLAHLDQADRWLLRRVPFLRRFCRYVVLTLRRAPYN
jgi:SAM-dependent methyltransferase